MVGQTILILFVIIIESGRARKKHNESEEERMLRSVEILLIGVPDHVDTWPSVLWTPSSLRLPVPVTSFVLFCI